MERTKSGAEVSMLVTEYYQAKDPKQRFGFVRIIDKFDFVDPEDGYGYPGEYGRPRRTPEWIEIFKIKNLGDTKLGLGEEWLLKVLGVEEASEAKRTRDGRRMAFIHVELVRKIEVLEEEQIIRDKNVIQWRFRSGKRVRFENIPISCRNGLEYRLPKGKIIKIDEITITASKAVRYIFPRITEESSYVQRLSKDYRGILSPEAIRKRIERIQPAPEALLTAIADGKISVY